MLALAAALAVAAAAAPSDQTLVFYNARLALRDGKPEQALKLWLVRNSLEEQGEPPDQDDDFHSVVWASTGSLGLCQDGLLRDDRGAGLWPLGVHNWVIRAAAKGDPSEEPPPFEAFEVGRQQRFISLRDVLDQGELRSVRFFPSFCLMPYQAALELTRSPFVDLQDRFSTATVLRALLVRSLSTLSPGKVRNVAAVEARIFDLDLALAQLQARRSRQAGAQARRRALEAGLSAEAALEVRDAAAAWPADSPQARFLRRALDEWTLSDWLSLSKDRRLFVFAQARRFAEDPARVQRLELSVIDALIERKEGEELQSWIGFLEASSDGARRAALASGDRGQRLLALDASTGFRERAVIALHRGVAYLEAGETQEALRSLGLAMALAEESREPAPTLALARRWLGFVLARYRATDEVIATLRAVVPQADYNSVVEDLVWSAALRGDLSSFERVAASMRHGSAMDATLDRLRPLARAKPGELATMLRDGAAESPHATLRFSRQLLERIEAEELDVRNANAPLLKQLLKSLEDVGAAAKGPGAQSRTAEELSGRVQAVLEGLRALDASTEAKARAMGPRHEAFAGNVRLAPGDPLPWPFKAPEPAAPSPFTPLRLIPVEWRAPDGALVFGWRLTE